MIAAGCSGQGHPCIERQVTIDRGVYGEVVYIDPESRYTPLYNVPLKLQEFGTQLTKETRTNEDGLYEFELPISTQTSYAICTEFAAAPCQSFAATGLVRLDLVIHLGLVYWDTERYGECP